MSQLNGDKARFQRQRKARLLRRDRARAADAAMKRRAARSATPANEHAGEVQGRLDPLDPANHEAAR